MSSIKLLLNQLNSIRGIEANENQIKRTLDEEFDIAIFPEMFYSGYLTRDNVNLLFLDERFIDYVQARIAERMIIFGAPFRDRFLYNAAVSITKRDVKVYYKMHLPNFGPFEEVRYFRKGNSPLTVDFNGFKVGIEICYDLFFDDSVEKGVDIMVNISASPFTSYPFFERVFPARAIENQSYLVYVNTAGLQRNQVFWGGSRVLDPDGKDILRLKNFEEDRRTVAVDSDVLELSRRKRRVLSEALDNAEE
jgi:NAD+ synthase (glutamine-hydrolysing)